MKVCLIYRKKNPLFFSIEKVFGMIEPFLLKSAQLQKLVLPNYSNGIYSIAKNLWYARNLIKSDVYHMTGDNNYMALVLPSSKTVLTIHDCNYLHQGRGIKKRFIKWLYLQMPVKRARIVTTISEKSRQEVIKHSNCDPKKVIVIPNPVNHHIGHVPKDFNTECPVILFIGSTPNKNLERVIEALQGIKCKLVIIGKINTHQKKLLIDSGVSYSLMYGLTEQQIAEQYAGSDIMLFPSTYEGFGLPIIEAQKAGRVVITSNLSPMSEVAGQGALLVDPQKVVSIKEAVLQVIKSDTLRQKLIEEGFNNIEQYNSSRIADKYKAVYDGIVSNNL